MTVLTRESQREPQRLLPLEKAPAHVAIIMDGNGRWARRRGLPRTAGHRHGTENLRQIIRAAVEFGVRILTIYAFSTENWSRPRREVMLLMRILEMVIDRELQELHDEGVQIRHIGELDGIEKRLARKMAEACAYTRDNNRLILNVAFNYGGRDEIVRAVQRIVEAGIAARDINEATISDYLYTSDLPDPDLIIRTSGEFRLSNFLIWQGAYSEIYTTETYWPDFDRLAFHRALTAYGKRQRRFGKTGEQIEAENRPREYRENGQG